MKLKHKCPKPESQKNNNTMWRTSTDVFNEYAILGLEKLKSGDIEMSENQKQYLCETIINAIIDYFSKTNNENINSENYAEFEEYNKNNLKTFEREFMLCLSQVNLSKESMEKYMQLIEEGSSFNVNISTNEIITEKNDNTNKNNNSNSINETSTVDNLLNEQKAKLDENTSKIFSSLCLNSLFDICDCNNEDNSSASNSSETFAPILLNVCEITIKNYVKDYIYVPAEKIPKSRTNELDNILDRLYKLNFKNNLLKISDNNTQFPYRKSILSGNSAHLFYLHSSLIECIGLMDKNIQNKVKLCLNRIGQEL
eukprot:jgi/Orpsp1_1/1178362/evm.model.c7180000065003.1